MGAASHQILPQIKKVPGIELTAGVDIRKEAFKKSEVKYKANTFPSVKSMCESEVIDAVWIATPNTFHAEHTVLAAENTKHVIVEKPMAVTLDEGYRMIAAAERNKVKML